MEERQRERDIRLRELEINSNANSAISSGSHSSIQNVKFPAMRRFVDVCKIIFPNGLN